MFHCNSYILGLVDRVLISSIAGQIYNDLMEGEERINELDELFPGRNFRRTIHDGPSSSSVPYLETDRDSVASSTFTLNTPRALPRGQ